MFNVNFGSISAISWRLILKKKQPPRKDVTE